MCEKTTNVPALFGKMVFGEQQMQQRLPAAAYQKWQQCLAQGTPLDRTTAGEIANAMKDWAIEKGATHYTHWFQPMTGVTAEKHDSFITRDGKDGVVMELSAKELSKGEADASSFPSGGLRATFEARGYTAWDPTSYAFVKDETLYIPTIFCSYSGQTLDKKTPLLRSMRVLDRECIRILRLFGNTEAQHVTPQVGPEQEYFLIDEKVYRQREDLKLCGRTLFGARPSKGQELDDHYYGAIKPRVAAFMRELDQELWKLGVLAKTEHNEVAPAQHEIAPIYSDANSACDKNQLTMELLKKVAARHGLVCLLHEKPFAGVNGSGKHDNWSLATDTGENLLKPGSTPSQNAQFLLFLAAFIKGVDEYQEMLPCCVSYPGNDPRLGGNERVGVFATRSPSRPNGLGLSAVELERVALDEPEGPVLYVRGADMVSGTPIVDIKPYLAYADSYPDAAGGFTGGDAGAVLTVDFPPELLAQFGSGQRHGLLSALAADPRPRYQDDPDRVYGMAYAGKNVRFTVQDGTVRVVGVE